MDKGNEMAALDVSKLSLDELLELKSQAEVEITKKIEMELTKNLETIAEIIRKNKIPFTSVLKSLRDENAIFQATDQNGEIKPLYYNPANPIEMYDGAAGRKPKWFSELEKNNKDLSKFEIDIYSFLNPYKKNS
ncbi:hypothetical protein AMD27_17725 (plasmid) [Acinetobacter sp. TGL-Y2]|uniref:H-NS family nucleoid-associated regulatory protein n=1 Tax=Acinetobacter sp. TGL-Y2 TaxID=1407071 RepID=UPI0007A65A87|nr:H-NS family nucleoid-associated regulatory protein [Acinetobacter sp. TGL-Y2]AMW80756.1 hypothetical protein AMD27_17725 [Acinetobacter sp. TGL-Y2]